MNRMYALALGLVSVLMATAATAAPPSPEEIQAPRGSPATAHPLLATPG